MRIRLALGIVVCGLFSATAALGQTFYKSTMPDGKIVIGDKPAPGAAKVEEMRVSPGNVVQGGNAPAGGRSDGQRNRSSAAVEAQANLRAAQERFDAASDAAERGKEPQEGERTGTATGMSRLNDAYWERQKQLEDAVGAARQELDAARDRANEAAR